jgi:hypothetical protein
MFLEPSMGTLLSKLILGPGELVVRETHIEGEDHQMTVRMLVNALFWAFVIAVAAFLILR